MDPLEILKQLLIEAGAERRQQALVQHVKGKQQVLPAAREDAVVRQAPEDGMPVYTDNGGAGARAGGTDWYKGNNGPPADAGKLEYPEYQALNLDKSEAQTAKARAENNAAYAKRHGGKMNFEGATADQALKAIAEQLLLQRSQRDPFVFDRHYGVMPRSEEDAGYEVGTTWM